jgi:hypothetical protein
MIAITIASFFAKASTSHFALSGLSPSAKRSLRITAMVTSEARIDTASVKLARRTAEEATLQIISMVMWIQAVNKMPKHQMTMLKRMPRQLLISTNAERGVAFTPSFRRTILILRKAMTKIRRLTNHLQTPLMLLGMMKWIWS